MEAYGFTHPGQGKRKNEDHYLIKRMHDRTGLLAVADGGCGEIPGDQAALITKEMLADLKLGTWGNDFRLAYLVKKIDRIIHRQTQIDISLNGIGATVTAVFLRNGVASWVHVGDSRLYLWRDRKLLQVTTDQRTARIHRKPVVSPDGDAFENSPLREGCQCVGYGGCEPASGSVALKRGDLLLLTTAGFHEIVPAETIASLLKPNKTFEVKASELSRALLNTGCQDDATVVLAQI